MKKLLIIIWMLSVGAVWSQQSMDTFKNLIGQVSKLPIYRDGRLQTFVYSRRTQRHADRLELEDPIIDLIKKTANVDSIKYLDDYQPYDLDATLPEILKFWAEMFHSDGIIKSDRAFIDIDDHYAYGKDRVYFRSPMMDLNGVGFRANFKERNVTVESQVDIRIRMAGEDPADKGKPVGRPVRALGDSLFIDFDKKIAILKNNVKVYDHRFVLTCDRLELDMNEIPADDASKDKEKEKKEQKGTQISLDSLDGSLGVSKVSCFGNVKIERVLSEDEKKKNGEQKAASEQAVYDVNKGEIVLSGNHPVMQRGEDRLSAEQITLWRESEKLRGEGNCQVVMRRKSDSGEPMAPTIVNSEFLDMDMARNLGLFVGNVRVTDQAMQLNCHRMELKFADKAKIPSNAAAAKRDLNLDGDISGNKELAAIKCIGDVAVVRDGELDAYGKRAPASYSNSGQLDFDVKNNILVLTKDNPTLKRGEDSVSGEKITVWADQQKMLVNNNSKIQSVSKSENGGKATRSYIKSDSSDLDYGKGLLTFSGAVEVRDEKLNLDCGKMIVYLVEGPKNKATSASGKKANLLAGDNTLNALGAEGGKELEKIYCEKDVHVDDPKGYLDCDYLTVYFEPVEAGKTEATAEGGDNIQVGNREIARLVSVGNVHFRGKDAPKNGSAAKGEGLAAKGSFNSHSQVKADRGEIDLRKNFGFFDGSVKMFDTGSGLTCSRMDFYLKNFKELPPSKSTRRLRGADQTTMPEQVGLGFGKELEKIICRRNVGLVRVEGPKRTTASGDYGEYVVANKRFDLLADPGKKVKLRNGPQETQHDFVQYWPESGMMSGRQGKVTEGKIPPGTF